MEDSPQHIHHVNLLSTSIGRTGRAGRTGIAMTFLTPSDEAVYYDLKEFMVSCEKQVPVELAIHEAARVKPGTITDSGHMAGPRGGTIYAK